MQLLKCLECDKPARWHVWYKGVSLPVATTNLAYNDFCDEHMIQDVLNGREGWQVVCVKLVADQFLPDDDRAKTKEGANES